MTKTDNQISEGERVLGIVRDIIWWKMYHAEAMQIEIENNSNLKCSGNFEYGDPLDWTVILTVNWIKIFTKLNNHKIDEIELA